MINRTNLHKYVSEAIGAFKKYIELVPSLVFIPIIFKALDKGKTDLLFSFIMVYIVLEIIIHILSKIIAAKKLKNASKAIRVLELNEKSLPVHQIAEILEEEGYKSIISRRILEKSIAKIIRKGNQTKAHELVQSGSAELSHKISKNLWALLIRFIVVIIFLIGVFQDPSVAIDSLKPNVSEPQPIGTDIIWTVDIENEHNEPFDYEIQVDDNFKAGGSGKRSDFKWTWKTSTEQPEKHIIKVIVWPKNNKYKKYEKSYPFELYNEMPKINSFVSHFHEGDSKNTGHSAMKGTPIYFTVEATDNEKDILNYRFAIDGDYIGIEQPEWEWKWDTSKTDEGIHKIGVSVTDGKEHAGSNEVNMQIEYKILPIEIALESPNTKLYRSITKGKVVILKASVPEEIERPEMQYRFYVDNRPETEWQKFTEYRWNTTNSFSGEHTINVKMRFGKRSLDEYDAETSKVVTLKRGPSL